MKYKHQIIIIVSLVVVVGAGAYYLLNRNTERENAALNTDGGGYAEEEMPHADPMIVGKWQNRDNPQWYKAYYDDFDEDKQMFWGKEWNEAEDVFEQDLTYHGNGWFRWRKEGKTISEFSTMDIRDVPVCNDYIIKILSADSLVYIKSAHKKVVYRFLRAE